MNSIIITINNINLEGCREAVNLVFFINYTQSGSDHYIHKLPKAFQREMIPYFKQSENPI